MIALIVGAGGVVDRAWAQEPPNPPWETRNTFGMTGLIDMPSARVQPDGQLSFTSSYFGGFLRNTLTFQVLPRVEAAFRYSVLDNYFTNGNDLYDRSFDLKFLISDETPYFPAIAVGLRDLLGTGVYSAEYVVGTKTLMPGLSVTGGVGWGRLADNAVMPNPLGVLFPSFKTRDDDTVAGEANFNHYFHGPSIGLFGGVEWHPDFMDGLSLKAEFSSDNYTGEERGNGFETKIPFNFGAEYQLNDHFSVAAYAMYGNAFGLQATITGNPSRPIAPQDLGQGPMPLRPRPPLETGISPQLGPVVDGVSDGPALGSDAALQAAILDGATEGARWAEAQSDLPAGAECPATEARDIDAALGVVDGVTFLDSAGKPLCSVVLRDRGWRYVQARRVLVGGYDTSWAANPAVKAAAEEEVARALNADRLELVSFGLDATKANIEIVNPTYNASPQAIGRAATTLANALPPSVEDLEITLVERDLPKVTVKLRRSRLEAAADTPDAAREVWVGAEVVDAAPAPGAPFPEVDFERFPTFSWFLTPALPVSFFDPDQPVRADLQLRAGATVTVARGLSFGGSVSKSLIDGFSDITRQSDSTLPHVRSDFAKYLKDGDPGIQRLTADYLFKLRSDTFGRLSLGLLEQMFGGVSAEVLWKPVDQNWGLGAEVDWVQQRTYDMMFSFQEYNVTMGHASVYWDTGWYGMEVQVDAGRYLAGDWGGTFSLKRRFANGWEIGGYFTLTDVPFDEYGEGSFDKGLYITIPFRWGLPYETRTRFTTVLKPLTRDGGAQLNIANRLYPIVQDSDRSGLREDWGTFWQ